MLLLFCFVVLFISKGRLSACVVSFTRPDGLFNARVISLLRFHSARLGGGGGWESPKVSVQI